MKFTPGPCPFCGADFLKSTTGKDNNGESYHYDTYACGTEYNLTIESSDRTDECYQTQIADLESRLAKLESFTPTSANINNLPEGLRKYIHDIETLCDPAGMVQEIAILKETQKALLTKLAKLVWTNLFIN